MNKSSSSLASFLRTAALVVFAFFNYNCADSVGAPDEGTLREAPQAIVDSDDDGFADQVAGDPDNCPGVRNPAVAIVPNLTCSTTSDCVNPANPLQYRNGTLRPTYIAGIRVGQPLPVTCVGADTNTSGLCGIQPNMDRDGRGDACDLDNDDDNTPDSTDNCPTTANPDQANADGDTTGDACDVCPNDSANDSDGDGHCANADNCPTTANADQADADSDGIGNVCDGPTDSDGDGIPDATDNCVNIANPGQANADGDTTGDACDVCTDLDNDTFGNAGFPANTCALDNCPNVANRLQTDTDSDGLGDACDASNDSDGDGVTDDLDNCPLTANPTQSDADTDGIGDACDTDCDDDGVGDGSGTGGEDCTPTTPVDGDLDGRSGAQDCNDSNPYVYVGASELCDDLAHGRGVDNDCDGIVDDGCPAVPECDVTADCESGEVCIAGACLLGAASGQCSPFAIEITGALVASGGGTNWYGEWFGNSRVGMTRSGEYPSGITRSLAGECSLVAWDFVEGQCSCHTVNGETPCEPLPESPSVVGCTHDQR